MQSTIDLTTKVSKSTAPFVAVEKMAALVATNINYKNKSLLEKLQQTLNLDSLCKMIATEASKSYKLCGLSFVSDNVQGAMPNSQRGEFHSSFKLFVEGQIIGSLIYQANEPLTAQTELKLNKLHQTASYSLRNACQYNQLLHRANQDSLTGLSNRSAYNEQMSASLVKARNSKNQMGLFLIDLNNFKPINDSFGHHIGDLVLVKFAQALTKSLRVTDKCFRFGGDEFAVIIENATLAACDAIKSRLYQAISDCPVLSEYQLKFSSGTSFSDGSETENELFVRADQKLYQEKSRNQR